MSCEAEHTGADDSGNRWYQLGVSSPCPRAAFRGQADIRGFMSFVALCGSSEAAVLIWKGGTLD